MSLIKRTTDRLSSNDKVIHWATNSFQMIDKTLPKNIFPIDQHRQRTCSENDSLSSSSSSIIDSGSSLSDPVAHCSINSSNISSDEDLDFNIGFEDEDYFLNKNNADAETLFDEPISDEYFRQTSNSTVCNDNDNTIITNNIKQQRRPSILNDSTYTLCSSVLPENDQFNDEDDEQRTNLLLRSNSFSVLPVDDQPSFVPTAPKKIVKFADAMGLDLESIRYMTPPSQSGTPIIQECLRVQFGQLRLSRSPFDMPNAYKRSSSSSLSLPSSTKQYNLVSKNFTSPIEIIPLIYEKQVLLECLYTKDASAYGTVRVHNCAYDKRVFIRLTTNDWETTTDLQASHSMNYSHDNTDTFTFQIILPKSTDETNGPKRILFAVCFQAMNEEFWDNNQGWNHVLDVYEKR